MLAEGGEDGKGERRDMGIGCLYLEKRDVAKGCGNRINILTQRRDIQHLYVHMSICYTAVINVGSFGEG